MEMIDQAWSERKYDEVLLLLQKDSPYPANFNLKDLNDCDAGKSLKDFVCEIMKLHEHVRNGDLERVKEITSRYKSEFYLNPENLSAARIALKHRRFRIYAYLKSIGVVLSKEEKYLISSFDLTEKEALREILRSYFPSDDESLISYLTLKSESVNPPENFRHTVRGYYTKLNKKISDILKVTRYENNLEINFDCKDEDVIGVSFLDRGYGLTLPHEKTIYLGSKREENEILGTIAHELTHLALEMVFKNECRPYGVTDKAGKDEEVIFGNITENIHRNLDNFSGDEAKIIARAFEYEPEFYHSELIVRVSQILTAFENGENWLKTNVQDLLKFYNEKVIPKCREFVSRSFLIKPRNMIKTLNAKFGEISALIKCGLFFENLEFLHDFLNSQKISFFITKNTRLGLLRILQALHRKTYVDYYDNFVVFKFQDCVNFFTDIKVAFGSEATDFLLLDCDSVSNSLLKEGILDITHGLGDRKKIIFVAEENQSEIIEKLLESNPSWGLMRDENFCLDDLGFESQKKILEKEISFQGNKTNLNKLFGQDKEFRKLVNADVIGQLVSDGQHKIGNKIFGISSLEGSYAQIVQEISISSLTREIKKSDRIFVLMGDKNDREKLIGKLNLRDDEIGQVNLKNYVVVNKRVLWTDENFEEDFKKFCQSNPRKKVYLICAIDGTFMLQQIYNPDFYMKRKIREIVIDGNKLKKLIETCKEEKFIFSGGGTLIETWEKKYPNVKQSNEPEVKQDSEGNVHWFQVKNGALIWKHSRGYIRRFYGAFSAESHLIEENDLVKDIIDKKAVVISDEPGMGKSTTITKLYESSAVVKRHWIIRINLKDCLKTIRNLPSTDLAIKNVISFLQGVEPNLNNTLTNFFFESLLDPQKKISKDLLLVFDGFDELLDEEDRNRTLRLLSFLKNKTKSKIWIASRLHYKGALESTLNTFALRFDPIDNDMKREFIQKYYRDRLNLILDENEFSDAFSEAKLEVYVENYIQKMESIFQENLSAILGTPLQLNLLLENSTEYFINWSRRKSDLDFSYLGSDPFEVYDRYVDRKYDVYFKKKHVEENQSKLLLKTGLERYHKNLTMRFFDREKISLDDFNRYQPSLLLIGLVQLQNENLQFFHFTFREFYSAKILVEFLTDETNEKTDFVETAEKLLVEVVAKTEYKLIRRFIDCQLQKVDPKKINPKTLEVLGAKSFQIRPKSSFGNWLMGFVGVHEVKKAQEKDFLGRPLHVNVLESNSNIFYVLFSNLKSFFESYLDLITIESDGKIGLLYSASISGNPKICDILFEAMEKIPKSKQKQIIFLKDERDETVLHVAAKNRHFYLVKTLLEKIKSIFSSSDQRKFFMEKNSGGENILMSSIRQNNAKVIQILLENAEQTLTRDEPRQFFTAVNNVPQNILFFAVEQEDPEILQILVNESGKILPEERNQFFMFQNNDIGGNLLLLAARRKSSEITKAVLRISKEILAPEERKTFFLMENVFSQNALYVACEQNNLETVEILLTEAGKENFLAKEERLKFFMAGEGKIGNVLLMLVKRNKVELLKLLLMSAENMLTEEGRRKFFMSKNSKNGNVFSEQNISDEVLNILSEWGGKTLTSEELTGLRQNR